MGGGLKKNKKKHMNRRKCNTIRGKKERRQTASVESFTLSDYWSSNREKNTFRPTMDPKRRQP